MHPAHIVFLAFRVMITVHLSMKLLSEHVLNWKKPKEEKAIIFYCPYGTKREVKSVAINIPIWFN